jgi:hypothetical protein
MIVPFISIVFMHVSHTIDGSIVLGVCGHPFPSSAPAAIAAASVALTISRSHISFGLVHSYLSFSSLVPS